MRWNLRWWFFCLAVYHTAYEILNSSLNQELNLGPEQWEQEVVTTRKFPLFIFNTVFATWFIERKIVFSFGIILVSPYQCQKAIDHICLWIYFWSLYSVPLICKTIFFWEFGGDCIKSTDKFELTDILTLSTSLSLAAIIFFSLSWALRSEVTFCSRRPWEMLD